MGKRNAPAVSNDLQRTDRLLAGDREPPLGSHLVTPRRGYLHHGIYVGGCKVVHYSGLAHGLRGGPVEEVPLSRFASRQRVWIRSSAPLDFDVREVIRRARSRVGEDRYRLLTNNCEHFCEWCLRGTPRSLQVEAWLAWPGRVLRHLWRSLSVGPMQTDCGVSNSVTALESPVRGDVEQAHMP